MYEFDFPYTNHALTTEVNRLPNQFGLLNAMDIAPIESKGAQYVRIDLKDGVIQVLPATERGGAAALSSSGSEGGLLIQIPHFPLLDKLLVDDADGMLEVINGKVEPRSIARAMVEKFRTIRASHAITLEFLRLGMLRGEIRDGSDSILLDLYQAFDIQKKTVDFKLGTAGTSIHDKCEEVLDHVQSNIKGETSTGVAAIVDGKFMSALYQHPKVEKYALNAQNTAEHAELRRSYGGGNYGRVLRFGEIDFVEYKGSMPLRSKDGKTVNKPNVEAKTGSAFPQGTQSMMRTFEYAPRSMDRVNKPTKKDTIHISAEPLKHGKGVELESQTNRIAICKQPECLVQIHTSN